MSIHAKAFTTVWHAAADGNHIGTESYVSPSRESLFRLLIPDLLDEDEQGEAMALLDNDQIDELSDFLTSRMKPDVTATWGHDSFVTPIELPSDRYWAVTGRFLFDDEDCTQAFEAPDRQSALIQWEAWMRDHDPDNQNELTVTCVASSAAPITVEMQK